uniref:ATP synthase CF1 subunit delta n=1 Tax=Bornetia secundiflora TaxID=2575637 RepID=A0A4D6WR71_9FLOR|nr:ATP synthase CF1 subunit delta [Bornetia secundiflora]
MSNQMYRIATPYAEALLASARKNDLLPKITQDLSIILEILSHSLELRSMLSNPMINILTKKNILQALFKDQIDILILNFLFVLVDRRRIFLLDTIIEKYLELTYAIDSTVVANVSTAIEFTAIQQSLIIEKIKTMTSSKNVKLVMHIDSSLMGGFVLTIGSKVIDTSLSGKLRQISLYLNRV